MKYNPIGIAFMGGLVFMTDHWWAPILGLAVLFFAYFINEE